MSTPAQGVTAGTEIAFRVQLPEECPLSDREGEILSANPHFVGSNCRCEFVIRPEDSDEYTMVMGSNLLDGGSCICRDIHTKGSIPIFDRIDGEYLSVSTLLESRDDACSLYEDLRNHTEDIEIVRIVTDRNESPCEGRIDVDKDVLTAKQREALEMAVCRGYYETPRNVEVKEMADQLGISRQAFSHRLRQAESKVLGQLFHRLQN